MPVERFEIQGMSCQHCVARVRQALEAVEGAQVEDVAIGAARVQLLDGRATRNDVLAAIRSVGYSVE